MPASGPVVTTVRRRDGEALLELVGLTTHVHQGGREVAAIRAVDLAVRAGEAVALVGESGSGKTVTALSILGLVPPPGRVAAGAARWRGRDLTRLGERALQRVRGREIGFVPQDPATALSPVFTIGDQIVEVLIAHGAVSRDAASRRMAELLESVEVPDPARRAAEYPHQLSGGLRQRVMIALGLAAGPALLIADEPTTGLDAATQTRIVALLRRLVDAGRCALLLISHDLGVVAACADRVAVMYAGQIVEQGPATEVLERPGHPYTDGLLAARPAGVPGAPLAEIGGMAPRPGVVLSGCGFAPRCPRRWPLCDAAPPDVWRPTPDATVRCHLFDPAARDGA